MCNDLSLKILIHIFTIIYFIMIIIIMRGENFVAHLDGHGRTPVCRGNRLRITLLAQYNDSLRAGQLISLCV
jgi:hypothetical protein